jgi:transcriptional regulator with XRE-family HTH domain
MHVNPVALRTIRERSGLSCTALAEAAGIRQAHLSNIEAGRRGASPAVALALADALKVDVLAILNSPVESAAS